MQEQIINFIYSSGLSPKAMIVFLASLPVTELRASIPIGILILGQTMKVTFFFSVLGNLLPVAPIYFFLEPVSRRLSRTAIMQRFFEYIFKRARQRAALIEKYEALGLMIFVCIPLPGTGVWTGCIIASLLRMRFLPTFAASTAGVILAGIIVTILTILGKGII